MFPTKRAVLRTRTAFSPSTALALAIGLVGADPAARAGSVTFATFSQSDGSAKDFIFSNTGNGTPATFTTGPSGSAFDFKFSVSGLAADLRGYQNSTMTMNLTASAYANQSNTNIDTQPLTGTIVFTRDTAANEGTGSRTNLLTITISPGATGLSGTNGLDTGSVNASGNSVITFSSDFVNFANATTPGVVIGLTSITPALNKQTLSHYLDSFVATGSGSAASDSGSVTVTATPEPSTYALVGGASGVAFLASLLKKRYGTGVVPAAVAG